MKPANVYLIGLTGNIACGKSTVVALLRDLGAHVIDADAVTRAVQQPGEDVYDQIVAAFGADILTAPGGPIDRKRLAAIVFADPTALRRLEQLVHPAVHARLDAWLAAVTRERNDAQARDTETGRPGDRGRSNVSTSERSNVRTCRLPTPAPHSPLPAIVVIDAIKLLEAGWKDVADAIWVVACPPEQQLARLIATRGMSDAEARARIAAQPPQADKIAQADVVIDNGGTLDATRRQVEAAWRAIVSTGA